MEDTQFTPQNKPCGKPL